MKRFSEHIILKRNAAKEITFSFDGKKLKALEGEVISSALIANGIQIFSKHHKDNSPQGIFCANGQCAQCTVLADGLPVKSCITAVTPGMDVRMINGLPQIKNADFVPSFGNVEELEPDVLIIGGGPAGLTAAIELGKLHASVLIIDDKHRLGGKLVLQTHKFFGSVEDCFAGTRGTDIARKLETELSAFPSVQVWLNSMAVGIFSDKKIGVIKDGKYYLIKPRATLVAAGAREKSLAFKGNTLPGVYGAGAFQTLANRDMIAPSKKLFIAGGGNVGLIAGYHAIQAGIEVVGLAEALPEVGGYKVHADKLKRLGVPIYTSHTIVSANGKDGVESVTIAKSDEKFNPIKDTEQTFAADTLLVAVGLTPCAELYAQGKDFGMNIFAAGDAEEIAEASAAMFSGRIAGNKIANSLSLLKTPVPTQWQEKLEVLKSRPGKTVKKDFVWPGQDVFPVFHCRQEIPCNPCVSVCPKKSIRLEREGITSLPIFDGNCLGCMKCLTICPGLAVTIVDARKDSNFPTVALAFEIGRGAIKKGEFVKLTDAEGRDLATAEVTDIRDIPQNDNTLIIFVKADRNIAPKAAGIKLREWEKPLDIRITHQTEDSVIICRCERVPLGEIRAAIRAGVRDLNQLKAQTRAGMGACGGKTCEQLILSIYRSEGVPMSEITLGTSRPLVAEVFLGQLCNAQDKANQHKALDSANF